MRICALIAGLTLLCTVLVVSLATYHQMVTGGKLVRMKMEGAELAQLIWRDGEYNDSRYLLTCSNSTEALLHFSRTKGFAICNWGTQKAFRPVTAVNALTTNDNIWFIAKNLPPNAPGQVIVLASRNVSSESLRASMSTNDMFNRLAFSFDKEVGVLKRYAVLIRKDGRIVTVRANKRTRTYGSEQPKPQYPQYGYIYGEPFDVCGCESNGPCLMYLTPWGELHAQCVTRGQM